MKPSSIRHTVVFTLKYAIEAAETQQFLADGTRLLAAIPSVRNFECLRQVSPKNDYDFGFSMEFENQAGYDAYNIHPDHEAFVKNRWIPEVVRFLEIDYQIILPQTNG